MVAVSNGSDLLANELFISLIGSEDFTIPNPDVDDIVIPDFPPTEFLPVTVLTNETLTDRTVNGTGTFDALMESVKNHIIKEYEQNRITGNEYVKAYIELTQAALTGAVQYLLGKDSAYWQAVATQQQAKLAEAAIAKAKVDLETAKVQLAMAQMGALAAKADYALTKIKLSGEDAQYGLITVNKETAVYNLAEILPVQKDTAIAQKEGVIADTEGKIYNTANILPAQKDLLLAQIESAEAQTEAVLYNTANMLPAQLDGIIADSAGKVYTTENLLPAQLAMVKEQAEAQRAQTLDTRSDGTTLVVGSVGKQKDLYAQQITSYMRDAEVKAAKIYSDAWITQKTLDEGLIPPDAFTNATIDEVMTNIQTNNNLD